MAALKPIRLMVLLAALLAPAAPAPAQEQPSVSDDLDMQARAQPYIAFADQILIALSTGQSGAFRASLSPTMIAAATPEELDAFVDKVVMPFFADYAAPGAEQWIAPATHPAGFTGFAFYRSFTTTNGRAKPYVLYLLEEDGRMVVGNLLVGKTYQDMHPQQ